MLWRKAELNKVSFSKLLLITAVDLLVLGLAFGAGFGTAYLFQQRNIAPSHDITLDTFWEVWRLVEKDFIGTLPGSQARVYGAIRGSLASLNDPYTVFVEPQSHQREKEDLRGSFGGIGVTMSRTAEGDLVLSPLPDSPALKAGIQDGDVMLEVDGQPITPTMSFDDIAAIVRGQVGTQVKVTVRRAGQSEPLTFTITRQVIDTPSVRARILEGSPQIGYIAIDRFTERTGSEVQNAIKDLKQKGATQIILDLRDNGGGLLDSAVDVASQFVGEGVVLYEKQKGGDERTFQVKPGGQATDLPTVVLVNHATASASEIVAGALRDHQRAVLIGEQTYGKGSVQHIYDLSDGSSLHVTAAEWFTPFHHQLTGNGLKPDIVAPRSSDDAAAGRDPQLERAVTFLREGQ
jgi:carboxyl-terminal processing protease